MEEEGPIEDSESQDGPDSHNEKTPRSGAMTEERRQKLREIVVRNVKRGKSEDSESQDGCDSCSEKTP